MTDRICAIQDCGQPHCARGYCQKHYARWRRYGDLTFPVAEYSTEPLEIRWLKWVVEESPGCWLWQKPLDGGYGRIWVNGRHHLAHRYVYELLVGPIPDGLHLDHLCRVTNCVNPDHLEPVTCAENIRRGTCPQQRRHKAPVCAAGHEFTPENTYRYKNRRKCRICHRDYATQRRRRTREHSRGKT